MQSCPILVLQVVMDVLTRKKRPHSTYNCCPLSSTKTTTFGQVYLAVVVLTETMSLLDLGKAAHTCFSESKPLLRVTLRVLSAEWNICWG